MALIKRFPNQTAHFFSLAFFFLIIILIMCIIAHCEQKIENNLITKTENLIELCIYLY